MPFMDIASAVVSDTTYCNGELSAKDVSITLPEVAATVVDIQAMGTLSVPLWQVLEDMESSINKIGVDMGLSRMVRAERMDFEHRWAQVVFDKNGNPRNVGCKAFISGIPKNIPGIELNVGEAPESEITLSVLRYRLVVDGEEAWNIDRLANVCKIHGKDYAIDISSLL